MLPILSGSVVSGVTVGGSGTCQSVWKNVRFVLCQEQLGSPKPVLDDIWLVWGLVTVFTGDAATGGEIHSSTSLLVLNACVDGGNSRLCD